MGTILKSNSDACVHVTHDIDGRVKTSFEAFICLGDNR